MKIVHRKRALHKKKLLRFTDNGAKIALARFLEASLTMRQSGMHKIENPSISGTHFF